VITVFDIATPKELRGHLGIKYDKEQELKVMRESPDYNNAMLALLYAGREDNKRADEYLELIKDSDYRQDYILLIHELVD
jgi:hypothetical protein